MKNFFKEFCSRLFLSLFVLVFMFSSVNTASATTAIKIAVNPVMGTQDGSLDYQLITYAVDDNHLLSTADFISLDLSTEATQGMSTKDFLDLIQTKIQTWAGNNSYTVNNGDIFWLGANPADWTKVSNSFNRSFTNNPSHSFVTTAAAANGFQLSTTRDAQVSYSVTVSSAVQIGVASNVEGYAALEIAATNSTTAGDWKEISRVGTGQNIGLAIALSSTQTVTAPVSGIVPAGYYARLRTVNSNGTPTYTFISGQEVLE